MWEEKGEGRIGAGCGHACGAAYVETVGVVLQRTPRLISPYTVCPLPRGMQDKSLLHRVEKFK